MDASVDAQEDSWWLRTRIPTLAFQPQLCVSTQKLRHKPRGVEETLISLRLNFSEGRLYQYQARIIANSIQVGLKKMEICRFTWQGIQGQAELPVISIQWLGYTSPWLSLLWFPLAPTLTIQLAAAILNSLSMPNHTQKKRDHLFYTFF